MKVIGLTGGTGSGKSVVSKGLAAAGAVIVDADKIAHDIILKGEPAYNEIIEYYGMDILDRVPAMTDRKVNIGSGTLYTLLEQFLDAELIQETKVEGRRRSYILTDKGKEMLEKECLRLEAQLKDYRRIFGEG